MCMHTIIMSTSVCITDMIRYAAMISDGIICILNFFEYLKVDMKCINLH